MCDTPLMICLLQLIAGTKSCSTTHRWVELVRDVFVSGRTATHIQALCSVVVSAYNRRKHPVGPRESQMLPDYDQTDV
eukprot:COSAG02_NODE_1281_length_13472_cov_8.763048_15_plen_78_part_00